MRSMMGAGRLAALSIMLLLLAAACAGPSPGPRKSTRRSAESPPRSAEEVARRAMVIRALAAAADFPRFGERTAPASRDHFELERTRIIAWLKREGAWALSTPEEKAFLSAPVGTGEREKLPQSAGRGERLLVLLWALGLWKSIPDYDTPAPAVATLAKALPEMGAPAADLLRKARLRPFGEIEKAREAAELWHLRALARETLAQNKFPSAKELDELARDLREKARVSSFRIGPIRDGPTFLHELIRFSSHDAHLRELIPRPIEGDFPALGKKYAALNEKEFQRVRTIALHRLQALTWLAGGD